MSDSKKNTILVVDDSPANLAVLLETLEAEGFDVLVASDGRQALQRAEVGRPELILLDVVMPVMDGFETCRALKNHATLHDIPVIFMTALHDTREKIIAFEAGGVDYITKPFEQEEVLARVRTHLSLRHLQQNLEEKNRQLEISTGNLRDITTAFIRFLKSGSLGKASSLLLENMLRRTGSRCGFIGMLMKTGRPAPIIRVFALHGQAGANSSMRTYFGGVQQAIETQGFSDRDPDELQMTMNGTDASWLTLSIVQRNTEVGRCFLMAPAENFAGSERSATEPFLHSAGMLYAYEHLKQRETETRQQRQRAEETVNYLREEIRSQRNAGCIIGASPAFRDAMNLADRVAASDGTVLILGETGTGKELIAREIHERSPRCKQPLIIINCGAIPENLVESELFGHEKGAFTGAVEQRKGRFELADGGTLFLDEIGDMPLPIQSKLLRVLQEQVFERVGGSKTIRVDVRVLAATHRNLAQRVAKNQFRDDLYFRLNVLQLTLPPLRERSEDIVPLARFFLQRFRIKYQCRVEDFTPTALDRLQAYAWPGNVRELENIVERALIMGSGPLLDIPPLTVDNGNPPGETDDDRPSAALSGTLDDVQRQYILQTLTERHWVIEGENGAAARLGLKPSTLRNRMQRLGIRRRGT